MQGLLNRVTPLIDCHWELIWVDNPKPVNDRMAIKPSSPQSHCQCFSLPQVLIPYLQLHRILRYHNPKNRILFRNTELFFAHSVRGAQCCISLTLCVPYGLLTSLSLKHSWCSGPRSPPPVRMCSKFSANVGPCSLMCNTAIVFFLQQCHKLSSRPLTLSVTVSKKQTLHYVSVPNLNLLALYRQIFLSDSESN